MRSRKAVEQLQTQRRDEILNAALACFGKHGFHAASMQTIAREVGMSVGNLYNYFKGKEEIVKQLAEREINRLFVHLSEMQSTRDPQVCREFLRTMVLARLRAVNAGITLEIMAEATRSPEILKTLQEFDEAMRERLIEVHMQSNPALSQEQARMNLLFNMTLVDGLTIRALIEPGLDEQKLADRIADFLMGH